MKKILAIVCVLSLFLGTFTGCKNRDNKSDVKQNQSKTEELSDRELAKIVAKNLEVPDKESITYTVSEKYYWEAGATYYKNVDFTENGSLVASASVDPYDGRLLKNIYKYPASNSSTTDNILLSVLYNEKPFITTKDTTVYLKDYKPLYKQAEDTQYYQSENLFIPREYTFVDLDKDGQNELIISELPDADTYLILHKSNDKIYGYSLYVRWFGSLKSDGTFLGSNGAFSHDYNTINFNENEYNISTFAMFDYVADTEKPSSNKFGFEPDYEKSVFEINGEKVSFDKIQKFAEEWDKRSEAEWVEFN